MREHYGSEMLDAFVREYRELAAGEGHGPALWYTLASCGNVVKEGLRTRRRIRRWARTRAAGGGGGRQQPHRSISAHRSPVAWLADLDGDLRIALRGLLRAPGFALVAVLSLAVGIGVNTALATIVDEVWFEPVAGVPEHARVVETVPLNGTDELWAWTYPDFVNARRATTTLETIAALAQAEVSWTRGDGSEPVSVDFVSADFFRMLGVTVARGRDFLPAEDSGPGQHPVVIVSHNLWQKRLGGDDSILGATMTLEGVPYTVIGVAPADFQGVRPLSGKTDLWAPLTQHAALRGTDNLASDRERGWINVFALMNPGTTIDEATASLRTAFASLAQEYPETNRNRSVLARPLARFPAQNRTGDMLVVVALMVFMVMLLLIICGNVAGMMLARSAVREREFAVRMALGSGRTRLVRQLMAEATILALVGGALGTAVGFWITGFATPERLGVAMTDVSFRPSTTVLLFSIGLTLAATVAIGMLPAIRFSQPQLLPSLKDDAGGRRAGRIHRFAASAQTGIALALVLTASLFVRAIEGVEQRGLGFVPERLLITHVRITPESQPTFEQAMSLAGRIRDAVGAVPGVTAVSLADGIPLDLSGNFARVGRADQDLDAEGGELVEFTQASEGFFATIGTSIVRGRGIDAGDDMTAERVVVITEDLADALWPGEEALGKRLQYRSESAADPFLTVVGIAEHVASSTATRDLPHIFMPLRQQFLAYERTGLRALVVVRAALAPSAMVSPIQEAILAVAPTLPFPLVIPSVSLVERSMGPQRATASISAGLGVLALILAAIGVYGVVAFAVANRTREIGVRMAIGATRGQVLGAVFKDALRLAVPGLIVGGLLAAGIAMLMRTELLGLHPLDPVSIGLSAGVLFLVVLAASLIPARRASSVDPITALRHE
jgi:predicted permease